VDCRHKLLVIHTLCGSNLLTTESYLARGGSKPRSIAESFVDTYTYTQMYIAAKIVRTNLYIGLQAGCVQIESIIGVPVHCVSGRSVDNLRACGRCAMRLSQWQIYWCIQTPASTPDLAQLLPGSAYRSYSYRNDKPKVYALSEIIKRICTVYWHLLFIIIISSTVAIIN